MATLEKLTAELNANKSEDQRIKIPKKDDVSIVTKSNTFFKRRAWFESEQTIEEIPSLELETSGDKSRDKWRQLETQLETTQKINDKNWRLLETKLETKLKELERQLETSGDKSGDKWRQFETKLETKSKTKLETKEGNFFSVLKLTGQQKSLLVFIYQECKKARMKNTNPLNLDYIFLHTGISKVCIKKGFMRLEGKNYIIRKEFQNGRGGWTKYELPDEVFTELLQLEKERKLGNEIGNLETKLKTESETLSPSSSSISSLINTTTTREDLDIVLEAEFDITPLKEINFSLDHLKQLKRKGKLTSEMIQDSINHFAFDLEHNGKAEKIKGSRLNFFMGILGKGLPYTAPDNYESIEERTMKSYLEQKEKERRSRKDLKEKIFESDFAEWMELLTKEQLKELIPEPRYREENSPFRDAILKKHFKSILNKNEEF